MNVTSAILIFLLSALTLALIASYVCYRITFGAARRELDPHTPIKLKCYPEIKDRMNAHVDASAALPCERVTITARDGTRLTARYYHRADGAPLEIHVHGYRGHALRDFCTGPTDSLERGNNLLLIDQRAHGGEGRCITFGVKERYDLLSWIDYSVERFGRDVQIILIGMSMGAATVLMSAALGLPEAVKCVIADSPYTSPEAIIKKVTRSIGIPPKAAFPFIRFGAIVFGRFDPLSADLSETIGCVKVKTLIIHGEEDTLVPSEMSRELLAKAGDAPIRLVIFPGADHGMSYFSNSVRYLDEVNALISETIHS